MNEASVKAERAECEAIIKEAMDIVFSDRERTYGHPLINHTRTARMWEGTLDLPPDPRGPEKVCLLNIQQKISRDLNIFKRDNEVDILGFLLNKIRVRIAMERIRSGELFDAVDRRRELERELELMEAEEATRNATPPKPLKTVSLGEFFKTIGGIR